MALIISDDIKALMEERGLRDEDIKEVIDYAEAGDKLVDEEDGKCLGKKRLENFTVYAEYRMNGEDCEITNVYSHRIELTEDR